MAIRFEYQPVGIGGLAGFAVGRGRAQERQRRELTALTYQRQRDVEQRQFAIGLENFRAQNDLFSENRRIVAQRERDSLAAHREEEKQKLILGEKKRKEDFQGELFRGENERFNGRLEEIENNGGEELPWLNELRRTHRRILENKNLTPAEQQQALATASGHALDTFDKTGGMGSLQTPDERLNGANGPIQQHKESGLWGRWVGKTWEPFTKQPGDAEAKAAQENRDAIERRAKELQNKRDPKTDEVLTYQGALDAAEQEKRIADEHFKNKQDVAAGDARPTVPPAAPADSGATMPGGRTQQSIAGAEDEFYKGVDETRRRLEQWGASTAATPSAQPQAAPQQAAPVTVPSGYGGVAPSQVAAPQSEEAVQQFDKKWAAAKPGEAVRGPDGVLYFKRG